MSNHLRELLDCKAIMTGECLSYDSATRAEIAMKQLQESASRAICFYLGDTRDISAIDSPSLGGIPVDIPFQTCWFEFDFHIPGRPPWLFGVMADSAKPGEAWLAAFARISGQWNYLFTGLTENNMASMATEDDMESVIDPVYKIILGVIRTALCAMKCVNINRVEHIQSQKLQKAREKRGKKPLFSYWTLELSMPNTNKSGVHNGGTHASPRLHLRRGHPREYKPGMFCWVQPHAVGNKKLGIVHKDYSANYGTALAPNA